MSMKRWIVPVLGLAAFLIAGPAQAQEGPAGAGRAEITIIPVGGTWFTESQDAAEPGFGNYQLGGAIAYNFNRFVAVEGEIGSTVGVSQNLGFGFSNDVRTPDMLSYNGNLVFSAPTERSVVPYLTGGIGGLSLFSRRALGVNDTETFFASNVGGGMKWYAGRWGMRADYRFIAVPSKDDVSAFFGTEPRYGHRVYGALMVNVGR